MLGTFQNSVRTGIQALLYAESELGVKPRILGALGLDNQPVAEALRATAYVHANGASDVSDVSEALAYVVGFGKRGTMVIWPNFNKWSTTANAVVQVPAVA